jgi:HD-GYP domain-containing protein (c-di-GMP phosphodiesterase class II)
MKDHCRYGADMLDMDSMKSRIDMDIILYHHENLDGTGYDGLTHRRLTLGVRIVRVTDRFDEMTQPQVNGRTKSREDAFEELYRWRGILYDPSVVDALYTLKKMEGTADGYR